MLDPQRQIDALTGQIRYLTEENERLREQLSLASEALMGTDDGWGALCTKYGLTRQHEVILRVVYKRPVASREQVYTAMYYDQPGDWPEPKIIDVQLTRIRRRIPPNAIETIWGRGWRLTETGRAWLKQELENYDGTVKSK